MGEKKHRQVQNDNTITNYSFLWRKLCSKSMFKSHVRLHTQKKKITLSSIARGTTVTSGQISLRRAILMLLMVFPHDASTDPGANLWRR